MRLEIFGCCFSFGRIGFHRQGGVQASKKLGQGGSESFQYQRSDQ